MWDAVRHLMGMSAAGHAARGQTPGRGEDGRGGSGHPVSHGTACEGKETGFVWTGR